MIIGLGQVNVTVGALAANLAIILDVMERARSEGVQVLALPEMVISGYPAEDLLLREDFLADCQTALGRLAAATGDLIVVVGFPERHGSEVFNAMAVCQGGQLRGVYRKAHLPNYGVFDERRYHAAPHPTDAARLLRVDGTLIGLTICEDIWYPGSPMADEVAAGAGLVVNISASPFRTGVLEHRQQMLAARCRENDCAVAYCNLVGGQDELVFDGGSMVLDSEGSVVARAGRFSEELLVIDVGPLLRRPSGRPESVAVPVLADLRSKRGRAPAPRAIAAALDVEDEVYAALVLGVRDYVRKSGFARVLLGLSGGVDSALVALVAVDALGAENVTAVVMPSRFSSAATQGDARALASNLRIDCRELPMDSVTDAYESVLAETFAGHERDLTEENLQARTRGNLLMAMSNKFGWLLLTTGNKSEMSVGYATMYGDMAGGFAVIKDVPKQLVFALTRRRNRSGSPVPPSIIERPPSAELRADQRDCDSLPPYEVLDPILLRYIEEDQSPETIVAAGFDAGVVARVVGMVDRAEYKRRQAPPGIKITARAFGRDRRMPVVNGYSDRNRVETVPSRDQSAPVTAHGQEASLR